MVEFNYMTHGPNSIHMDVNDHGANIAAVYVNTDTTLDLVQDAIVEWDMLSDEQREILKEIARQISAILEE